MPLRFAVREIALAKGFRTARHLGEVAKVSPSTIYGIWDNKKKYVSFEVMERIARTLEVPAPMLLTDQPEGVHARAAGFGGRERKRKG